jgi:hypothetical protein
MREVTSITIPNGIEISVDFRTAAWLSITLINIPNNIRRHVCIHIESCIICQPKRRRITASNPYRF